MQPEIYIIENKHYPTLNILSLGKHKCSSQHIFAYAYTNFYLIHYVVRGCGTFYKNGIAHRVNSGEIFIIKPENEYTYAADDKDPWEYIFLVSTEKWHQCLINLMMLSKLIPM